MKFNKDSNSYTFIFSIIIVLIVGVILTSVTLALADKKAYNVKVKKMINILSAMGIDSDRQNGEELYSKHIGDIYMIDSHGNRLDEYNEDFAFNFDVLKQNRDKTVAEADRIFPIFEGENESGEKVYILSMAGNGLWGPVWGFVALADDFETIKGASFDHSGETPGLGAEIATPMFEDQYIDEKITKDGSFHSIEVVKDGTGKDAYKVDGITGGTVTSKGVERMVNGTLEIYYNYFTNIK